MKTIVDRRTWLRGPYTIDEEGRASSYLLDENDMMCCLGFRLEQDGVSDEALLNGMVPSCVYNQKIFAKENWLIDKIKEDLFVTSKDAFKAMEANDDLALTDEEREEIIKKIFEKNGEEIEFVGPRLPIINGEEVRYEDAERDVK